jgi:cytochrome P450
MKARIVRAAGAGTLHLFRWADRNLNGSDLGLNSSDNQQNPYAELNRIRTSGPVLRSFANRGWVILGFDEVQAAFKDTRFGSDLRQNKFLSTLIRATADGCPSSNKWDKASLRLSECFAHQFHVTRRVVDSANGVSRWFFV